MVVKLNSIDIYPPHDEEKQLVAVEWFTRTLENKICK